MKPKNECLDCGKTIYVGSIRCRRCSAKIGTAKVAKNVPGREKIPQMYQEGLSTVAIAKQVGLSKGAVHSILRCRGVKLRGYSEGIKAMYPDGRKGELASNWRGGRRMQRTTQRKYHNGILQVAIADKTKLNRKGDSAGHWKGGRWRLPQGYIYIYKPDHPHATKAGYVMEHRLLMEEHLGRVLDPKEIVHHLNGIKDDNRIENLLLMRGLGQHVAIHFDAVAEVARLKNIIKQYEEKYGKI